MYELIPLLVFYAFTLGLIFGSFTNMFVFRAYIGQHILGYSYCDKTGDRLKPIDLIPIISYIIFGGRCRSCGTKLPLLYPIIELIDGLLWVFIFLLNYQVKGLFGALAFCIIAQFLYILAIFDLLHWKCERARVHLVICVLSSQILVFLTAGFNLQTLIFTLLLAIALLIVVLRGKFTKPKILLNPFLYILIAELIIVYQKSS